MNRSLFSLLLCCVCTLTYARVDIDYSVVKAQNEFASIFELKGKVVGDVGPYTVELLYSLDGVNFELPEAPSKYENWESDQSFVFKSPFFVVGDDGVAVSWRLLVTDRFGCQTIIEEFSGSSTGGCGLSFLGTITGSVDVRAGRPSTEYANDGSIWVNYFALISFHDKYGFRATAIDEHGISYEGRPIVDGVFFSGLSQGTYTIDISYTDKGASDPCFQTSETVVIEGTCTDNGDLRPSPPLPSQILTILKDNNSGYALPDEGYFQLGSVSYPTLPGYKIIKAAEDIRETGTYATIWENEETGCLIYDEQFVDIVLIDPDHPPTDKNGNRTCNVYWNYPDNNELYVAPYNAVIGGLMHENPGQQERLRDDFPCLVQHTCETDLMDEQRFWRKEVDYEELELREVTINAGPSGTFAEKVCVSFQDVHGEIRDLNTGVVGYLDKSRCIKCPKLAHWNPYNNRVCRGPYEPGSLTAQYVIHYRILDGVCWSIFKFYGNYGLAGARQRFCERRMFRPSKFSLSGDRCDENKDDQIDIGIPPDDEEEEDEPEYCVLSPSWTAYIGQQCRDYFYRENSQSPWVFLREEDRETYNFLGSGGIGDEVVENCSGVHLMQLVWDTYRSRLRRYFDSQTSTWFMAFQAFDADGFYIIAGKESSWLSSVSGFEVESSPQIFTFDLASFASNCFAVSGIEEEGHQALVQHSLSTNGVFVYPTIFNNQINVQFEKGGKEQSISVFNVSGSLVHEERLSYTTHAQIDVESLPPGIYVVIIKSSGMSPKHVKVIKPVD